MDASFALKLVLPEARSEAVREHWGSWLADVLAQLATALDMLPSDLLRCVEEVSAKGHGLFRKRVLEAPMHEHAGEVPELAVRRTLLRPADRAASALDPEDLKILISLVGRLGAARKRQP